MFDDPRLIDDAGLFDDTGLLVSLPARELASAILPGSLFGIESLAEAPISPDLRHALRLIEAVCARRGLRMILVARPEIFTDPVTLGWLHEKSHGIRNHLCISDGMAIRVLPGLRNHMFLYRQGLLQNAEAFRRLVRRVPSFLATIQSQVNTAFRFKLEQGFVSPPGVLLQPGPVLDALAEAPRWLTFHLDSGPPELNARWILDKGPVTPDLRRVERAIYVPLTEQALNEGGFRDAIAAIAAAAYFDPTICLLLRPPVLASSTATSSATASATLADQLAEAVTRLRGARPRLPRVPAPGIFFVADDLPTTRAVPVPVTLVMPDSFDFWRHPASFYAGFAAIQVLAPRARRGERDRLLALLTEAFGRRPELRWQKPDDFS